MWPYSRRVLAAAWLQTAEWFRWGSWLQFVLRSSLAIIVVVAVGWLSGPLAALTTIGRTIAGVISAAVLLPAVYLFAVAVTAAKLDDEKDAAIADLRRSLARSIHD